MDEKTARIERSAYAAFMMELNRAHMDTSPSSTNVMLANLVKRAIAAAIKEYDKLIAESFMNPTKG
jgi:hypothetical protein